MLVRGFNSVLEMLGSRRYPPYNKHKLHRLLRLLKKRHLALPLPVSVVLVALVAFLLGLILPALLAPEHCHR